MKMLIETSARKTAWACMPFICFSAIIYLLQIELIGKVYISHAMLKVFTAGLFLLGLVNCAESGQSKKGFSRATKVFFLFCCFYAARMALGFDFEIRTTIYAIAYSLSLTPILVLLVDKKKFLGARKVWILLLSLSGLNFLIVYYEFLSGASFFSPKNLQWLYQADLIKLDNLMGVRRYGGLFKRPIEMGIFFGFFFLLSFWVVETARNARTKVAAYALSCCSAFLVMSAGVRGVFIGLIAALVYLLVLVRRKISLAGLSVLLSSGLFCVLSVAISPYTFSSYLGTLLNPTNILNRLVIWASVFGFDISFISIAGFRSTESMETLRRFSLYSLKSVPEILFGKGLIQNSYISGDAAVSFDSTYVAVVGACGVVGLALFLWAMGVFFRDMNAKSPVYGSFMVFMFIAFLGENLLNVLYFPFMIFLMVEGARRLYHQPDFVDTKDKLM